MMYTLVVTGIHSYRVEAIGTIIRGPKGDQGVPGEGAFVRSSITINASKELTIEEAKKVVQLDGTNVEVELTIDPVLLDGYMLIIRCMNNNNATTIKVKDETTQRIEVDTDGSNRLLVELDYRQTIYLTCVNGNIQILK